MGLGIKYKKLITYKFDKAYKLITQTQEAYNLQPSQFRRVSMEDTLDGSEIASIPTIIYNGFFNTIPGSLGFYFTINGFIHFTPKKKNIP